MPHEYARLEHQLDPVYGEHPSSFCRPDCLHEGPIDLSDHLHYLDNDYGFVLYLVLVECLEVPSDDILSHVLEFLPAAHAGSSLDIVQTHAFILEVLSNLSVVLLDDISAYHFKFIYLLVLLHINNVSLYVINVVFAVILLLLASIVLMSLLGCPVLNLAGQVVLPFILAEGILSLELLEDLVNLLVSCAEVVHRDLVQGFI